MDAYQNRYSRQILFQPIGRSGQEKLKEARVAVVGMGALGTVLSNHMVRAGVGFVRIIDRDFVEDTNLQRQMLYDETDASEHLPKAIAAAEKLSKINSLVQVEPVIADLNATNGESFLTDVDLILDGTDNFTVRYLINDIAVKHRIPWIYGGAVSSKGMFAAIRPHVTPCYRCLFPKPPTGRGETCDTAGVIGPIIHIIASYQAVEALKILTGAEDRYNPNLEQFEVWNNQHMQMDISRGRNENCPACGQGEFEFLNPMTEREEDFSSLCGRDTVQVVPREKRSIDLSELAERLQPIGTVEKNAFLLRFHIDGRTLVFFGDGRVLIQGTDDIAAAKTLYAKYVGN
ncbi:ThiF family adenylyltransferase [Ammoniphilus sp. CFH 90114]|uniref:ThiF family adenylyltransferase n=1 Tax=Ammoniphilus sp. CFH 90114 TaxID=2493665 RepID=UPI00100F7E27|nr:ThiF family adenylyltransferase [Ammoniphilus sp. CFH 90114]RXT05674.1 thiazole biosynthesis adenylyltransferase ThiF [Ammoniphilus sp. CFH 90114]